MLLSLNGDFAHIVNYPPAHYSGIVAVQLRNDPRNLVVLQSQLSKIFSGKANEDFRGKLVIVDGTRARIRS